MFDDLITSQKQKADEEWKLVEELNLTKGLLIKAHQDLEDKTIALDKELKKVNVNEVSTQTVHAINDVSSVKQEESKIHVEEKHKAIPCKYFHRIKGCQRGNKCWFSHDEYHKAEKKSSKINKILIKKLKN